jgi:RES domain-containing protein
LSTVVWRIATEAPLFTANDMTGKGAALTGGRWNAVGTPMVYCASNIALAALETLSHIRSGALPYNRYLVQITIPENVWLSRKIGRRLPAGWDAIPHSLTSERYGEGWVKSLSSAVLEVPSVIVNEESNVLINPSHPDAGKIKAKSIRRWSYDPRFF